MKKKYSALILVFLAFSIRAGHAGRPILDAQGRPTGLINANPDPDGTPWIAGGIQPKSREAYEAGLARARRQAASMAPLQRALPASVDNSKQKMLVPIFEQWQGSCGAASGTGYVYTYEINALRGGLDARLRENQYPYNWVWHFTNEGSPDIGSWNHNTFELANALGIPKLPTYGGAFRNQNANQWITGYDKYLEAFKNRGDYVEIPAMIPEDLEMIKGWLFDHGDGSPYGGILNFDNYIVNAVMRKTPAGFANAGKSVITKLGDRGAHSMTIVGYDDSIRYDVNGDSRFTNNLDINNDAKVDIADWEIGAFHIINTWGTGWADAGHSYMLYRTMGEMPIVLPDTTMERGFWGHIVKSVAAKEGLPSLDFKVNLTTQQRNQFYLQVGMASDINATEPEEVYDFYPAFWYSGGELPALGAGQSSSIELGLDLSRFTLFNPTGTAKYWLVVETRRNAGILDRLTLMDHTSGTVKEIPYEKTGVALADSSLLYFPIVRHGSVPVQAIAGSRQGNFRGFRLSGNHIKLPDQAATYELLDIRGNRLQRVGPGLSQLDISPLPRGNYVLKSAHGKFAFVK